MNDIWPYYNDQGELWLKDGYYHRCDGPAVITVEGRCEFWVNVRDITLPVKAWQTRLGIAWPWDQETTVLFQLIWGSDL